MVMWRQTFDTLRGALSAIAPSRGCANQKFTSYFYLDGGFQSKALEKLYRYFFNKENGRVLRLTSIGQGSKLREV